MANGFRTQSLPSRKEQARAVNTELENMQQAIRISQMMLQQLLQSNRNMSDDLGRSLNLINELQYKIIAVQEVSGLDTTALNDKANALRLKDFNEASAKEDAQGAFTEGTLVDENSTVILTSTTADDKGIFRSRLKLVETGVPELIQGLQGKEVGAKVEVTLNGSLHTVELLGIKQPPAPKPQEEAAASVAIAE